MSQFILFSGSKNHSQFQNSNDTPIENSIFLNNHSKKLFPDTMAYTIHDFDEIKTFDALIAVIDPILLYKMGNTNRG